MERRVLAGAVLLLLAIGVAGWFVVDGRHAPAPTTAGDVDVDGATETARTRQRSAPDDAPPAEDAAPPYATGIVVDEAGSHVADARVVVRGHAEMAGETFEADVAADAEPACTTDGHGRFVLRDEPDDVASLLVVAAGFEIAEVREPRPGLRVVLRRCETFATRVVDSAGRPVVGARVVVMAPLDRGSRRRGVRITRVTDSSGTVALESLPPGAVMGSILAPGYTLPELAGTPFGTELRDEYVLTRTAVIVDVSAAEDGAPLGDAGGVVVVTAGSVVGTLRDRPEPVYGRVPPGRLLWRPARGCTGIPLTLRVFAPGRVARSLPITLAQGVEPPHIAESLALGAEPTTLTGRVIDGAGAVVTVRARPEYPDGFHLEATDLRLPAVAAVTIGEDGAFTFSGLPPATYCVTVETSDRPVTSIDVAVPAHDVVIEVPAAATLDVTVTDDDGSPVAQSWVHVQTRDGRRVWAQQTDDDGRARFDPVPAVELDVVPVRNTGGIPDVVLDHPAMPHARVHPAPGATESVTLVLPAATALEVVVLDDTGAPVRDATVRVRMYRGLGAYLRAERQRIETTEWTTDADGRVSLTLPPSGGDVRAISRSRTARAKFSTADDGPVEIRLATEFGTVRGRVVERDTGRAIAGRPLTLWSDGQRAGGSTTDADGRFVVGRVPAGRVKVAVDGRRDEDGATDAASPHPYASVEIALAAGEERTVEIALPRVGGDGALPSDRALSVRALDGAGTALEGATVIVHGLYGDVRAMLADARTDAEGRARLDVPAADRYEIVAVALGRSASVSVAAEPAGEVEVRLPAE